MSWQEIPRHLQVKYLHAAAITTAQLARLLGRLRRQAADVAALELMLRRFQGLAVWAGMHGLSALSVAAQIGEHDCATLAGAGVPPEPAHLEQIAALVEILKQEIYRQRTTGGVSDEFLWARLGPAAVPPLSSSGSAPAAWPAAVSASAPPPAATAAPASVFPAGLQAAAGGVEPPPRLPRRALAVGLVEAEWSTVEGLLARHGFALQAVETCREAGRVFAAGLPDAVIAAADLPDGTGLLLAHYLRAMACGDDPAIVVVGEAGGEAAATGAFGGPIDGCGEAPGGRAIDAWFTAPLDWVGLAEGVAALVEKRRAAPVLLYLEGYEDAGALRELLRADGYRVRRCREPRLLAGDALASDPDLVLLDVPLAGETAGDLVGRLRGNRHFAAVPILLLEEEEDEDGSGLPRRVSPGGAEHLARPIEPRMLLATIAARIEHHRALVRLFAPPAPLRPAAAGKELPLSTQVAALARAAA